MNNMLEDLVESQIKSKAQIAVDAVLDKVPELKELLSGQPVELVITLQLRPKAAPSGAESKP